MTLEELENLDDYADMKVTGMVNVKHFNAAGDLLNEFDVPNAVVVGGLGFIACRLTNASCGNQMSHMALGADGTANTLVGGVYTNTTLGSQLTGGGDGNTGRVALTTAGGTAVAREVTYGATFASGVATGSVQEAGIFNASSGGLMLARTTFPVITKQPTDSLAVTWKITLS